MSGHLLHIGYPKAGSTYLQRWFAAHPQLAYREGGIAGFHDVYQIARDGAATGDEPLYRVTSMESLSIPTADAGEMIVDYDGRRAIDAVAAQLRVCRVLANLFAGAVVLIVTRGFGAVLLSTYSQFVRSGGYIDLNDLIAAARSGELDLVAPWDYDRLIAAYMEAFGADNVIVLPYELLRDDAGAFTGKLVDRLGIEPFTPNFGRVNESLSPAEMYWYPRFARLALALRSRRLFGGFVRLSFANRLRRPIALLEKLWPGRTVSAAMIPDDVLEPFRGRAERLRGNPLYAAYMREYLLD